ncbi:hypothetical protein POVWA2_089790 [Plasmodium ovale wallikeri]|uniref:STP1 protein n=1 Tax=Plasmodium ovale wallikeri TaxID=864142 RepID=A0A1A9AS63_PLAOA|nr:hypothetical protein POVWA2_089790 [Plasmodium ovale wallikeri]
MAGDSGYSIYARYITPEFFISMIASDIKELIHTYGHKNCGLRQEELCDKIKKLIPEKKKLIFEHMDSPGKRKWNNDWDRERSKYFDKLYKEEGFINMCFPKTYPKKNQSLDQLLSRHIQFCKKKDVRRAAVEAKHEYNACRLYDSWIEREKASFTREYLENVTKFKVKNVDKYFSTKEHPGGHDPRRTYNKSKLDCEIYNPASNKYQEKLVEKAPTKSRHPPAPSDVGQESQGKSGKSAPDRVGDIQKNKPGVQILHQTKPSSSDSHISSLTDTKVDGTPNGQHADFKAKGTYPPINAQDSTGKPTGATDAKAPSFQQVPEPPSLISPKDSLAATVPNLSSVIKVKDTDTDATLNTTSATSGATHSIQNVSSPSAPDLSLAKPQPPAVAAVIDQNSKETTPPDPVIKSKDHGAPLTSALDPHSSLDPGLSPSKAEASSSSASGTPSTLVSTTTDSIAGSPPPKDSLLITVSPQSTTTTTTPIVTTPSLTQTTSVMSDPFTTTVSSMGTKAIPSISGITSTTESHGNPQVLIKTLPDSQDPSLASPKKKNGTMPSHLGTQSPDQSSNLNINLSTGQTLGTSPGPLRPLPDSPADPPPGLSSPIPAVRSPEGSPDVSSPVRVVNKPGKHLNYNLFIQSHL